MPFPLILSLPDGSRLSTRGRKTTTGIWVEFFAEKLPSGICIPISSIYGTLTAYFRCAGPIENFSSFYLCSGPDTSVLNLGNQRSLLNYMARSLEGRVKFLGFYLVFQEIIYIVYGLHGLWS